MVEKQLGEYRILGELGHGGMGVVYLAEHIHLKKKYALKLLPEMPQGELRQQFIERFQTEGRVMANLEHPGIVRVIYMGIHRDRHYLVMEYVEGPHTRPQTLEDRLKESGGKIPADEVLDYAIQITRAIRYAHRNQVVHRDIKPANVLITRRGQVKVTDFGLAKILGEDYIRNSVRQSVALGLPPAPPAAAGQSVSDLPTRIGDPQPDRGTEGQGLDAQPTILASGPESSTPEETPFDQLPTQYDSPGKAIHPQSICALVGTYDFMAPEQKQGKAAREASDIYALGAMFYYLLTGMKPMGIVKPPSELGLSKKWDFLLSKCLRENPADRFRSMDELLDRLDSVGKKSNYRWIWTIGVLFSLPALLAVIWIWTTYRYSKPSQSRNESRIVRSGPLSMPLTPTPLAPTPSTPESASVNPAGMLRIITRPSGAAIEVDGQSRGNAPLTLHGLSAGMHRIQGTLGKQTRQQEVYLEPSASLDIEMNLEGDPGGLQIVTNPPGASIFLDNVEQNSVLSPTLFILSSGEHTVKATLEGYRDHVDRYTVASNETATVRIQMALIPPAPTATPSPSPTPYPATGALNLIDIPGANVKLEMVFIPPGSFRMGSPDGEEDRSQDETVREHLPVDCFWLGKYEVTQRQWEAVMGTNPSFYKGPDLPVEGVSWNDCQAFIAALNARTRGVRFRLPTEEEWEYACRAGTQTRFSFGNGAEGLIEAGWFLSNSSRRTFPVGQKHPNAWGLYDMHGNVWEWCENSFGLNRRIRLLRGGAADSPPSLCRCAARHKHNQSDGGFLMGFRLAMTVIQ